MNSRVERYDLAVFGGGGHARVLLDTVFAANTDWRVAILDPHMDLGTYREFERADVVGGDELAPALAAVNPAIEFAVGLGAVGPTDSRKRLFELGVALGMTPYSIIHPRATISPGASVEDGAQVMAGAVVNVGATIGRNVVVNTRAVVEHDCIVEDHANIAPGACLCGNVVVGGGAFVGACAVIIQDITIGKGAVVGAGSVVIRDVDPGVKVVGTPARPLGTDEGSP